MTIFYGRTEKLAKRPITGHCTVYKRTVCNGYRRGTRDGRWG